MMHVYQGTVTKVARDTTGWGDSERMVGVRVTLEIPYRDQGGEFKKTAELTIPFGMQQPQVGDVLTLSLNDGNLLASQFIPDSEFFPEDDGALVEDDEEEDGEDIRLEIEGDPFADEIKQG
jgi:hypothetical protein